MLYKQPLLLLLIPLNLLLCASRYIDYSVGSSDDILSYYFSFLSYSELDFFSFIFHRENMEPLFQAVNYLIGILFGQLDIREYIFLISLPSSIFLLRLLYCFDFGSGRKFILPILLTILSPPLIIYETQLIRQFLALLILFNALFFGRTYFFILLLVSIFIHYSVIVFFPLLLLIKYGLSVNRKNCFFVVFLFASFVSFFLDYTVDLFLLLTRQIDFLYIKLSFLKEEVSGGGFTIQFLILYLVVFVFLFFSESIEDVDVNTLAIVLFTFLLISSSRTILPLYFRFYPICMVFLFFLIFNTAYDWLIKNFNNELFSYYFASGLTLALWGGITWKYLTSPGLTLFNGYFVL